MSKLAAKIAEVMGEVGKIPKKGKNKEQNYSFVQESDIVEAVRKKFAVRQVAILPTIERFEIQPIESQRGNRGMFANVIVCFEFVDGESGERLKISAAGSGTDYPGDKAVYKAMTGAKKYALTMGLLIATGEDPEQHLNEPAGTARRPQANTTEPAQPTAPANGAPFSCPVLSPEGWPCTRPTEHKPESKAHFFAKPKDYSGDSVPGVYPPKSTPPAPEAGSSEPASLLFEEPVK